jgi:acetyltransferase-like isoleucine patch superfamily enzyme
MLRQYNVGQLFSLFLDVIRTKLIFSKARLIRSPNDIRGRKFIAVDTGFTTGRGCRLEAYPITKSNQPVLVFGKNIQINDYVHITAMEGITIGDNALIASKVYISDCSHGSYAGDKNDSSPLIAPKERPYQTKKVIIGDNVWIGEFVTILPGVKIGNGTIVGANSVVTKSLPAYVIAVGSPAKPIKKYNFDNLLWEKY